MEHTGLLTNDETCTELVQNLYRTCTELVQNLYSLFPNHDFCKYEFLSFIHQSINKSFKDHIQDIRLNLNLVMSY